MATEGALLSMIANDEKALRVLAAWGAAKRPLRRAEDEEVIEQLAELSGVARHHVRVIVPRLRSIGCIRDRDISELADRLLQQRVLSATKTRRTK